MKPKVLKPYLDFAWKVPEFMLARFKPTKEKKRAMDLRKAREEFKRRKKEELQWKKEEELERLRKEQEMIEKALKMKKKEEAKQRKMEIKAKKYEKSLREARTRDSLFWRRYAQDEWVTTMIGVVLFLVFYQTVVLGYKKQRKDYEDRLKIETAEAEERKKMRQLEKEMGIEEEEDDESVQGKGEQNPNVKMATQFMKSGAREARMRDPLFWRRYAQDERVTTKIGVVLFLIFYQTVVLGYKKQRKDFEDRLKIEMAEAEERKKMRQLGKEIGIEEEEDDETVQGNGEQNPNVKMAMQFMKSGERVRRAQRKRLPQYMDSGVDVKFTDVAGLGKKRLELEEIVKFFTDGEIYRRRGVKIPGWILEKPDKLF